MGRETLLFIWHSDTSAISQLTEGPASSERADFCLAEGALAESTKRWRKKRRREGEKNRGRSHQSSELSMFILPSCSFIFASISFNPTLSLSLCFSPFLPPSPFTLFLYFSFSPSQLVPFCLYLHPYILYHSSLPKPFNHFFHPCPASSVLHSLSLLLFFSVPSSLHHPFTACFFPFLL